MIGQWSNVRHFRIADNNIAQRRVDAHVLSLACSDLDRPLRAQADESLLRASRRMECRNRRHAHRGQGGESRERPAAVSPATLAGPSLSGCFLPLPPPPSRDILRLFYTHDSSPPSNALFPKECPLSFAHRSEPAALVFFIGSGIFRSLCAPHHRNRCVAVIRCAQRDATSIER